MPWLPSPMSRWRRSGPGRRDTGRKVATYGDIASAAGLSSPRIVGWIMRTDSSDLPWHRVITASGGLPPASGHPAIGAAMCRGCARRGRTDPAGRGTARFRNVYKHQSHQRGGAGQAQEAGRGGTRCSACTAGETSTRATTSAATPAGTPSLDETVVGLAPGQRVDHHHPAAHDAGPPVRGDVGDTRGRCRRSTVP